jgi:hypothetical protein
MCTPLNSSSVEVLVTTVLQTLHEAYADLAQVIVRLNLPPRRPSAKPLESRWGGVRVGEHFHTPCLVQRALYRRCVSLSLSRLSLTSRLVAHS